MELYEHTALEVTYIEVFRNGLTYWVFEFDRTRARRRRQNEEVSVLG